MSARIDIRVERTQFLYYSDAVLRHPALLSVKMRPPAAGPEVELTFSFGDAVADPLERAREIVNGAGMTVLASRNRRRSSHLRRELQAVAA